MPQVVGFVAGLAGVGAGAAIGTTAAFAAGAAAKSFLTTTFLGKLLSTVAVTALQYALAPKPTSRTAGIRTSRTLTGGTTPASFILGTLMATSGQLVAPPMSHGSIPGHPNAYLNYVVEFGDIPGQQLVSVIIDGEPASLGTVADADYGLPIEGRFTDHAWVKYYDGSQTAADPMLVDKYGTAEERAWGSDRIGSGIPYAVFTFKFNREVFNAFPTVRIESTGIPLYDPRKDSTAGGIGLHRWDDNSTWEPSDNPVVQIYNIMRGIDLAGGHIWGGETAAADMPLDVWWAAMNNCDVQRPIKQPPGAPAVSEAQYRSAFEVQVSDNPADVIQELLKACNGQMAEIGGVWKIRVGGPGLPLYFFDDGDIVEDDEARRDPFPSLSNVTNAVQASFPNPDQNWQTDDAPLRTRSDLEAADGGRRLTASLNLPAVPYPRQVQHLQHSLIEEERRFGRHSLTLPPDAGALEPLDAVGFTSAEHGYDTKVFEVATTASPYLSGNVSLGMRERDSADQVWTTELELPQPVGSVTAIPPGTLGVQDWDLTGTILRDDTGARKGPGLVPSWSPDQPDANGIRWEIRYTGTTDIIISGSTQDVARGFKLVTEGVVPNGSYEGRARFIANRPTQWSEWRATTTEDVRPMAQDLDPSLQERLASGGGTNLLLNANFEQDTRYWRSVGPALAGAESEMAIVPPGAPYAGKTYPTLAIIQTGTGDTGYSDARSAAIDDTGAETDLSVAAAPNEWFYASAHLASLNCVGRMILVFRDKDGGLLTTHTLDTLDNAGGDHDNPDLWGRYWVKGQAPANTAFAQVIYRKLPTSSGSTSALYTHKPQLERTFESSTEPAPWSPPSAGRVDGSAVFDDSLENRKIKPGPVNDWDGKFEGGELVKWDRDERKGPFDLSASWVPEAGKIGHDILRIASTNRPDTVEITGSAVIEASVAGELVTWVLRRRFDGATQNYTGFEVLRSGVITTVDGEEPLDFLVLDDASFDTTDQQEYSVLLAMNYTGSETVEVKNAAMIIKQLGDTPTGFA
ncbi:MAG: phage tail protein [Pseudomonadota bacterium]